MRGANLHTACNLIALCIDACVYVVCLCICRLRVLGVAKDAEDAKAVSESIQRQLQTWRIVAEVAVCHRSSSFLSCY